MLQNARVAAFIVSELLREREQGGVGKITPTQIRVKTQENSWYKKFTVYSLCLEEYYDMFFLLWNTFHKNKMK